MDKLICWAEENVDMLKSSIMLILCGIFFIMLYVFGARAIKDRYELVKKRLGSDLLQYMNSTKWNTFNYYKIQRYLDSVGATYYSKGAVNPLSYMCFKILSSIAALVVFVMVNPISGGLVVLIAYFYMDKRYKLRNEKDNMEMMKDIMNIYDIVILQMKSGVYITHILIDAYMSAENQRLKSALLELTGKIKETNDIRTALEVFRGRFSNEHIENLTVAIGQAVETGNSVRMLSEVKRHMVNLQKCYNKQVQQRIKRRGNAFKIAIFAAVMMILMYSCIIGLGQALKGLKV